MGGCALQPQALAPVEVNAYTQDKLSRYAANQEPVSGSIDLYEAMARALKYNLDFRVELFTQALRVRDLDLASYKLLPNVVAGSGYAGRDNLLASSSESVATGQTSLVQSFSQPLNTYASDLTFSWNILDFGLSYVRALQASDEVLIAEQAKRKVISRIVGDVRTAYWRAYSAQRLVGQLRQLESRVRQAISDSDKLSRDPQNSPVAALTYERELIEIKRQLQAIEGDLAVAKTQLAALMNVPPGTDFTLSGAGEVGRPPVLDAPVGELITAALYNRAELRDVQYRGRINQNEATAALLELLPGLNLYLGANNDPNPFLLNNNWLGWGARASWNVMTVFRYPARNAQIEGQNQLLDQRALALTMAIITQVHVGRIRYYHFSQELQTSDEFLNVQRRLLQQIHAQAITDKVSEQTLIREEMNMLVAQAKRDISFAVLQTAYANIYESIGLDPYGASAERNCSVKQLAEKLKHGWIGGNHRPFEQPAVLVATAKQPPTVHPVDPRQGQR